MGDNRAIAPNCHLTAALPSCNGYEYSREYQVCCTKVFIEEIRSFQWIPFLLYSHENSLLCNHSRSSMTRSLCKCYGLGFIIRIFEKCYSMCPANRCRILDDVIICLIYFNSLRSLSLFSNMLIWWIAIWLSLIKRSGCDMPCSMNTAFRFSMFDKHIS